MKIICLTPVKNEEWIIGLSLRAVLRWVDEAVVLNHASTDGTAAILEQISAEHPGRVTILYDSDPTWKEMAHRQRLLETARGRGATHCAIVDADEVLTGNLLPRIRDLTRNLRNSRLLQIPMPCMWRTPYAFRQDYSIWSRAMVSVVFSDMEHLCWQQPHDGYDFHHRGPYGALVGSRLMHGEGGLMHLQFACRRRIVAKHALYKMTEAIRWPGKRTTEQLDALYNLALNEDGLRTSAAPESWWEPYSDLMQYLDLEHEPWQEAECRRLMEEHGPKKFAGLNLFGVVEAVAA